MSVDEGGRPQNSALLTEHNSLIPVAGWAATRTLGRVVSEPSSIGWGWGVRDKMVLKWVDKEQCSSQISEGDRRIAGRASSNTIFRTNVREPIKIHLWIRCRWAFDDLSLL